MDQRVAGKLSVSTGTEWRVAQNVSVMMPDNRWQSAKSVKVSDGAGGWTLVWAPAVGSVLLSTTPNPVVAGDAFTVTAEIVGGLPSGAAVRFYASDQSSPTLRPQAGETFVSYSGARHNSDGTADWYVDITITGNTTKYGPVQQVVEPVLTPPSLTLSTPVTQGTQWTALAYHSVLPPEGSKVRYVATNDADPSDVVDSGPMQWGATFSYTDLQPVTRTIVATLTTPAGQNLSVTGTIEVERGNYSTWVPSGGDLQEALDEAHVWFMENRSTPVDFDDPSTMATVQLSPGGTYEVGETLHYRGGVRLVAVGATIRATSGVSTHIFNNDDHGGGLYNSPHTDWMILGGTLDCQNFSGGISTTHTNRFRLDGVTIKNIGGRKHHLEINSSGGNATPGKYNCQIYDCTFLQETKSMLPSAARTNDESVQLDYSWSGAAPTTANDGTVTNNVHIKGCTFTNGPRAIGGHTYKVGTNGAMGVPTNIKIEECTFTAQDPTVWGSGADGTTAEGAVRVYMWSQTVIRNNVFERVFQPVMLYIPQGALNSMYDSTDLTVEGNTFRNCGAPSRHCIYGNADNDSRKKFSRVRIANNTVEGAWLGTGYFAGCDETDGAVAGYGTGAAIVGNRFAPTNYDLAAQAAYNKYRAANVTNVTGVTIEGNTISDGTVSNV